MKKQNLKLKLSKCELFMKDEKYLGKIVSENGVQTDLEKIKTLKEWPIPTNVTNLRSFLGFTWYYRRFIKDYAKVIKSLNDLLFRHPTHKPSKKRKNFSWEWDPLQQNAFDIIIEKLTSPSILAYAVNIHCKYWKFARWFRYSSLPKSRWDWKSYSLRESRFTSKWKKLPSS